MKQVDTYGIIIIFIITLLSGVENSIAAWKLFREGEKCLEKPMLLNLRLLKSFYARPSTKKEPIIFEMLYAPRIMGGYFMVAGILEIFGSILAISIFF